MTNALDSYAHVYSCVHDLQVPVMSPRQKFNVLIKLASMSLLTPRFNYFVVCLVVELASFSFTKNDIGLMRIYELKLNSWLFVEEDILVLKLKEVMYCCYCIVFDRWVKLSGCYCPSYNQSFSFWNILEVDVRPNNVILNVKCDDFYLLMVILSTC